MLEFFHLMYITIIILPFTLNLL